MEGLRGFCGWKWIYLPRKIKPLINNDSLSALSILISHIFLIFCTPFIHPAWAWRVMALWIATCVSQQDRVGWPNRVHLDLQKKGRFPIVNLLICWPIYFVLNYVIITEVFMIVCINVIIFSTIFCQVNTNITIIAMLTLFKS